jgi:hypothetical protein
MNHRSSCNRSRLIKVRVIYPEDVRTSSGQSESNSGAFIHGPTAAHRQVADV